MAAPSADRINKRAAKDRAFLKRALNNPGLRAKLDPKYLTGTQRQARELNTRLNAPVTPGSAVTERDLAHEAGAATTVRYGPQERQFAQQIGTAQTTERNTGSFYDQYLADLRAHQQNVAAYQAGAQAGLAQTAAGITGLSGAQGAQLQAQSNQAAQQAGGTATNMAPMISDATAVRQALQGSFQGQQAMQGAAANTYASSQANVVGPGQKLAALAQAAGRTRDLNTQLGNLRGEEGAFNQQFRSERRQDEFKNVLAQQTLGANVAENQAQAETAATNAATSAANAASNAAARSPEGKAAATTAQEEAKNAAKLGMSVHQYRLLGPKGRARRLKALKNTPRGGASDTRYTTGPFAGMLKSDVNKLSDSEARRRVNAYNANKTKNGRKPATVEPATQARRDFRTKYGVDLQPTSAHNTFKDQVSQGVKAFGLVGQKDKKGNPITTDAIVNAMSSGGTSGIPKLPAVVVRAALEIKRFGRITPGTANRLHRSGYSVGQLGYRTGSPPARRPRTPRRRGGLAGTVPGLGSTPTRGS